MDLPADQEPATEPKTSTDNTSSTWTYPSRSCRICFEDVYPTVTMYPPGVAMRFQRPVVEYKSDDEYGRLIKPCLCKGSSRYVHEMCLMRSRTASGRTNLFWQCDICKYKFNFQKLTMQRYLSSRLAASVMTILLMFVMVFILGFIADPVINLWIDPLDAIMGREDIWEELELQSPLSEGPFAAWTAHFMKGLISMGLVGFLKTLLLNPLHWFNIRQGGLFGTGRTANTGRDRAVNISWIAVLIGISSAFYFFYQWVQALVQHYLKSLGNNIVDTQLPDDDDDLKPPPGWKYTSPVPEATQDAKDQQTEHASTFGHEHESLFEAASPVSQSDSSAETTPTSEHTLNDVPSPVMAESWVDVDDRSTRTTNDGLDQAHRQGWSFSNL